MHEVSVRSIRFSAAVGDGRYLILSGRGHRGLKLAIRKVIAVKPFSKKAWSFAMLVGKGGPNVSPRVYIVDERRRFFRFGVPWLSIWVACGAVWRGGG